MQTIQEQFRGQRDVPPREYRSLHEGPGPEYPEVNLPIVGFVAEREVWAEFQVGVSETTWELVAAPGCMVEESAIAGLRQGAVGPLPEPEPEFGPPSPTE
jgi:hypothetical protein